MALPSPIGNDYTICLLPSCSVQQELIHSLENMVVGVHLHSTWYQMLLPTPIMV